MEQASDVVELVLPHEVDNPNNVYLYLEGKDSASWLPTINWKEMLGAHTNVQPTI